MKENLYDINVSWMMGASLKISAPSPEEAKKKAFMMQDTLPQGTYNDNSFDVDMVSHSEMQPSEWVEITKHPTLPCSLNSYINEGNGIEYIVEIDGNTEYHYNISAAMEDYVRRVVRLVEKREV